MVYCFLDESSTVRGFEGSLSRPIFGVKKKKKKKKKNRTLVVRDKSCCVFWKVKR